MGCWDIPVYHFQSGRSQVSMRQQGKILRKKSAMYGGINTPFCGSQLRKLLIREPVLILKDPRPKHIPKYFQRFINTYLRRAQISQYLVPVCTVVNAMLRRHAIYLGHVFADLMYSARDMHGSGCMPMQPSIWNFINVPWKAFVTRSCVTTPMQSHAQPNYLTRMTSVLCSISGNFNVSAQTSKYQSENRSETLNQVLFRFERFIMTFVKS